MRVIDVSPGLQHVWLYAVSEDLRHVRVSAFCIWHWQIGLYNLYVGLCMFGLDAFGSKLFETRLYLVAHGFCKPRSVFVFAKLWSGWLAHLGIRKDAARILNFCSELCNHELFLVITVVCARRLRFLSA